MKFDPGAAGEPSVPGPVAFTRGEFERVADPVSPTA